MNKKFLSIAASTAIVASALVFTGCGDSSSSSTVSGGGSGGTGTSSGTLVKGLWKGVSYSTNSSVTGTTDLSGTYTYKAASDSVMFDLGVLKINGTVASVFDSTDLNAVNYVRTNGTAYTAAQQANVQNNFLNTILTFVTSANSEASAGYDATTLIANLKKLQAKGLDLTESAITFPTSLGANMTAAGVTGNVTDPTTAQGQVAAFKQAIKAMVGTKTAAAYASQNNLNITRMTNMMITLANGGVINLTVGGGSTGSNATGLVSSSTAFTSWNASGSTISLGYTNMSSLPGNYVTFTGPLAAGVGVKLVDTNGNVTATTVSKLQANLYKLGQAGRFTNITLKDIYGSSIATVNLSAVGDTYNLNTTSPQTASNLTGNITYANGTKYTCNYSIDAANSTLTLLNVAGDMPAGALIPLTAIPGGTIGNYTNLSFDADPFYTENQGMISSIVTTVKDTLSRWTSAIIAAVSKLL